MVKAGDGSHAIRQRNLGLFLPLVFAVISTSAFGATFTVTNVSDPGGDEGLSLRQAISQANANADEDQIVFDASLAGKTIELVNGQLGIYRPVSINAVDAPGLVVKQTGNSSVFEINRNFNITVQAGVVARDNPIITVSLSNLTITGGKNTKGAGVNNLENLTIENCTIVGNEADGSLVFQQQVVVRIPGNLGVGGGVFNNSNAILTVKNSTIAANSAKEPIFPEDDDFPGGDDFPRVSARGGASAVGFGGGIFNDCGTVTILNSTISGNTATGNNGQFDVVAARPVTNNGSGIYNEIGDLTIESTIVVDDIFVNLQGGELIAPRRDVILSATKCMLKDESMFTTKVSNLVGQDAALSALASNGGPTQTMAIGSTSPAVDKGSNSSNLTTDQRGAGFKRVEGSAADIGAFEFVPPAPPAPPPTTPVVVNASPLIVSGPTATPAVTAVRHPVLFGITASDADNDPITITWDFGDGSTGTGEAPTHAYASTGLFTVTATVTDGTDTITGTVDVRVADPMYRQALLVSLNFAKANKDLVALRGRLILPEGFDPAGKVVEVNIGGVVVSATLNERFRALSGNFRVRMHKSKKLFWKFYVILKKADVASEFADEGMLNEDAKKKQTDVLVTFTVGDEVYGTRLSGDYSARSGKKGVLFAIKPKD